MRMISALLGIVLMSGSALAADLLEPVVPIEPVVVPEAFNWTGGYVGLNAGWAFAADFNDDDGNYYYDDLRNRRTFGWRHRNEDEFDGGFVGAQAGFNFQPVGGMFVFGVEGDIQWANIDNDDDGLFDDDDRGGSDAFTGRVGRIANRSDGRVVERFDRGDITDGSNEIDWFGTLRLRGGVALDRTLIYATGGLAFADADFTAPVLGNGGGFQRAVIRRDGRRIVVTERVGFRGHDTGGDDDVAWGWVLGGGVEHAFTDTVSVKAEYQYINLDNDEHVSNFRGDRQFTVRRGDRERIGPRQEFDLPFGHAGGDIDFHTLRVGVNVLF